MKVKDLMSKNITCATEHTPVLQLANEMRRNNIGSLPVCDQTGRLKGMVTDRDLVLRVLAAIEKDHTAMDAADVMTLNPISVTPDMSIHDAALLFSSHKIRRLPVTEASRIVGMLSLGDVAVKPVCVDEAGDALSAISLSDGLQG